MYGTEAGGAVRGDGGSRGREQAAHPVIEVAPTGKSFRVEAPGGTVEVLAEGSFDGSRNAASSTAGRATASWRG